MPRRGKPRKLLMKTSNRSIHGSYYTYMSTNLLSSNTDVQERFTLDICYPVLQQALLYHFDRIHLYPWCIFLALYSTSRDFLWGCDMSWGRRSSKSLFSGITLCVSFGQGDRGRGLCLQVYGRLAINHILARLGR